MTATAKQSKQNITNQGQSAEVLGPVTAWAVRILLSACIKVARVAPFILVARMGTSIRNVLL